MAFSAEDIKAHHRSISKSLTDGVSAISEVSGYDYASKRDVFNEFAQFLADDLVTHAEGEEKSMYPAVRDLVCRYGDPLETMTLDHKAIVERIGKLRETVNEMNAGADADRTRLLPRAKKLAIELGALVSVHLAKEEIALLPLMEEHMSGDEIEAVVSGMHGEGGNH